MSVLICLDFLYATTNQGTGAIEKPVGGSENLYAYKLLNSLLRNAVQSPDPYAASGLGEVPPSINYQPLPTAHCESCRKYPTGTWTTTSLQTNQEIFRPHARLFGLIAGVLSLFQMSALASETNSP